MSVTSRAADQHLRYSTNEVIDQPIRYSPPHSSKRKMAKTIWSMNGRALPPAQANAMQRSSLNNGGIEARSSVSHGPAQVALTPQIPATEEPFANWYRQLAQRLDAYGLNE